MNDRMRTRVVPVAGMLFRSTVSVTALFAVVPAAMSAVAEPVRADAAADDLKIDRKEVFEFTQKPTVARQGRQTAIRFASKDYCDAAVVIEDGDGRIMRHLAYGQHLATHTDRRLFIFDGVHDCIRSVKLDYHVSDRVPLD